jgi:hypothetical protein
MMDEPIRRTQCAPTLACQKSLRRSDRVWLRAPRPGTVLSSLCLGVFVVTFFSVLLCLCGENSSLGLGGEVGTTLLYLAHFEAKEHHDGDPQGEKQELQKRVADGFFLVQLRNEI